MRLRHGLLFGCLVGTGLVGLALFAGWWQVDGPGSSKPIDRMPASISEMDFELTDHDGEAVGPGSLLGRPSLIFFGFTYCPDVCPMTLSNISGWLQTLGTEADRLNVVFITVDPERDTIDAMAEYVAMFHPAIRGWTGSIDQIDRAAAMFRAKFEWVSTERSDYTVQHTASVFVFDAVGDFVSTIDFHEPREFAIPKIRRAMRGQEQGG